MVRVGYIPHVAIIQQLQDMVFRKTSHLPPNLFTHSNKNIFVIHIFYLPVNEGEGQKFDFKSKSGVKWTHLNTCIGVVTFGFFQS